MFVLGLAIGVVLAVGMLLYFQVRPGEGAGLGEGVRFLVS